MILIKALVDTVLKKQPIQSSKLDKNQVSCISKGRKFKIDATQPTYFGHLKVTLAYGAGNWYIYLPHWQIKRESKRFPTGLPKPSIAPNPSTTEVIEAIVNYSIRCGIKNKKHIAYILSTAENEAHFKPIREYRGKRLTSDQQRYWHTGFMGKLLLI